MTTPKPPPTSTAAEDLTKQVAATLHPEHDASALAGLEEVLVALLAGGHIREERGVRVTWPGDGSEDMWGNDRMANGQTMAEYRYELHNSDRTRTSAERIRRYVIVTAPTVVEETP